MTKDLEDTLRELGDEYRPVVARLRSAYAPDRRRAEPTVPRGPFAAAWGVGLLSAAALLAFLGVGVFFRGGGEQEQKVYTVRAADAAHEYMLAIVRDDAAVQEMIRTQRPDGGWGSDFLTRQNAAALRLCGSDAAQLAYRRAMRNLRLRGSRP